MFGLGGMWILAIPLAIPVVIGFLKTGKQLHTFLSNRGLDSKKAITWSFVTMVVLAGILSSPIFLSFPLVRQLVPLTYIYFLVVGGLELIGIFTGGNKKDKQAARAVEANHPAAHDDGDCGCDHEHDDAHGKGAGGNGKGDGDATSHGGAPKGHLVETDGDVPPARPRPAAPSRPQRSIEDTRREIERRIEQADKNGGAK